MSNKELSRDDLFLLMQSYRNTVESNTILLEQQKKLLEQHNIIIDKQKDVSDGLNKVIEKFGLVGDMKSEVLEILSTNRIGCVQDHGSIKQRMIFIYAGIGVIGVSLVSLVITVFNKMDVIEKIAKHLGVL